MDWPIPAQIYMGNGEERAQDLALTDDLLIRYLLGELEKAECLQVAERSFCDDDVFDRLLEAENDLVDRYVAGQLSRAERKSFEKAASERESLRQKVAFAGALRAASSAAGTLKVAARRDLPIRTDSGKSSDRKKFWYSLAAAASLLLVIGGLWIARRGLQTSLTAQRQIQDDQSLNAAPPSPGSTELSKDAQTTPSLSNEPAPGSDRAGGAGTAHNPAVSVATFVLLAGSTRSTGEPRVLEIKSGVRSIRLQLQSDESEEYPAYTAVIRTLNGEPVLKRSSLRPSRLSFGKALTLEVAARDLRPGQYEVEVSGRPRAGPDAIVNYYYFSIAKD
jgi:hypothetical protein